jgi:hypothetical protein
MRPVRHTGRWTKPQPDPTWWTAGSIEGRALREALRCRDVTAVFRYLKAQGWSRAAMAAATGISETRVRKVIRGRQKITSYDVLERIAEGLDIERGLMGLAYSGDRPM